MDEQTLMVIGAHADDIEFNFGGTALKYHEKFGYEIVYVMSTNNMSGSWNQVIDLEKRNTEIPEYLLPRIERTNYANGLCRSTVTPWYVEIAQRKKECADAARKLFDTVPIHLDHPQRHYTNGDLKKVELRYGTPRPDLIIEDVPSILTAHEDKSSVEGLAVCR